MYITFTIDIGGKRFDISADGRGSAMAAYSVLKERGLVGGKANPARYMSMLMGEWIDAKKPLVDQGVVSGDILSAQI